MSTAIAVEKLRYAHHNSRYRCASSMAIAHHSSPCRPLSSPLHLSVSSGGRSPVALLWQSTVGTGRGPTRKRVSKLLPLNLIQSAQNMSLTILLLLSLYALSHCQCAKSTLSWERQLCFTHDSLFPVLTPVSACTSPDDPSGLTS